MLSAAERTGVPSGPSPEQRPTLDPGNIPGALKEVPQWLVWRYEDRDGKRTKVPYQAAHPSRRASSTDPETWAPFSRALDTYGDSAAWSGLGFVLSDTDGLVGIDLDHCVSGDHIEPWAKTIARRFASYTEVSPSGTGLRIFVRGTLPPGGRKKGQIEIYDSGRFLTVTGDRVGEWDVADRADEIAAFHAEVFLAPDRPERPVNPPRLPIHLADVELIARMRAASNGAAIWALWGGDASGYGSRSEADLALCSHLAFWSGGNPARVDALFRQSHLFRDKWDERRGDRTYGQRTIERALSGMTSFWDPEAVSSTAPRVRLKVRPGEAPRDESEPLPCTDIGNAERLVARYGDALRYCHPWAKWLVWDGARWRVDDTGAVVRCAKATVRAIYEEAAAARTDSLAKQLAKHANTSQNASRLMAMIDLARNEPDVPVIPDHLDADPWLFTVQNGVVDLRTGELLEHDRDLLITKVAPVSFDPLAHCPLWEAFVLRVMGGNPDLVRFVQRAIGYSLTGLTGERVLFLLYGTGANGKSTLLEVLRSLLGDYAMKTPTDTLLAKQGDGGIPNDVARLKGARFVAASEADEGRRLAESLVKAMTGGDTISARFMRSEWFDFRPEFKLWLATNHKPVIRGTDRGIWDRIRLIPFEVRFDPGATDPEQRPDKALMGKLLAELTGILAWAIRGCLEWQRDGLGTPAAVVSATEDYRAEMDVLAAFLRDLCIVDPQASVTAKAIFGSYKTWCEDTGEKPVSQRRFGSSLGERGFRNVRTRTGYVWTGLRLLTTGESVNLCADAVNDGEPNSGINAYENSLVRESGKKVHEGSQVHKGSQATSCLVCGTPLLPFGPGDDELCSDCGHEARA